jgi:guanine nucleotide-binding protein subunit alpha
MGCGMSTEEKEGKARNEEIENQLKKDRLMQRNEIKMLLLGALPRLTRFEARLLTHCRCWRVGKVNHPEANEAHPRGWLLER